MDRSRLAVERWRRNWGLMRKVVRPSPSHALLVGLFTATFALTSPALATSLAPYCSQFARDQRVTGLEPGVWISNLTDIAGFVFFVVDAKPDGLPGLLMANLVSLGPFLSFAGSGCVVRPETELSENPRVVPEFKTRDEARTYRDGAIRADAFIMGLNTVASGVMLLFVHKPASRIALGASAVFPLAYSLVNFRKFSPDRDIDDTLPTLPSESSRRARLKLVPELDRVAGEYALGLGVQGRF